MKSMMTMRVMTPTESNSPAAVKSVGELWTAVGARVGGHFAWALAWAGTY